MRISTLINNVLKNFNMAVCKRTTLESLHAQEQAANEVNTMHMLKDLSGSNDYRHIEVQQKIDILRSELLQHQTFMRWNILDDFRHFTKYNHDYLQCPLCDYKSEKSSFYMHTSSCIFQGGDLIRFQCPNCDLIFGDLKMLALTKEALSHDYEWHYKTYSEGDSTEQEIRAFHMLEPKRDGVYLNYGAGDWSRSVSELRRDGWDVWAYEPHESANTSTEPYVINSKEKLTTMKFDGIFSNNVLEHLRYPVEEFNFMTDLLKNDSRMSHATPCFEYLYEYTRFHLFFYLGKSRELLAEKAGLQIDSFMQDDEFMCAVYRRQ